MMKIAAILLAVIAAISVKESEAAPPCFYLYTREQPGTSSAPPPTPPQTFTGITAMGTGLHYDIPVYFSLTAAGLGFAGPAHGRFSGNLLPTPTSTGPMTIQTFGTTDQIVLQYNKGLNSGTFYALSGCYKGVKGKYTRKLLKKSPAVYMFTICPVLPPLYPCKSKWQYATAKPTPSPTPPATLPSNPTTPS